MEYLSGKLTAEEVRKTDLYNRGDCINIWVNQGEFEMLQMEHEAMRQQLAQQPSVDLLVAAKKLIDHNQAMIDSLMLEFCPERMTAEQLETWKKHQTAVSAETSSAIDKAMSEAKPITESVKE